MDVLKAYDNQMMGPPVTNLKNIAFVWNSVEGKWIVSKSTGFNGAFYQVNLGELPVVFPSLSISILSECIEAYFSVGGEASSENNETFQKLKSNNETGTEPILRCIEYVKFTPFGWEPDGDPKVEFLLYSTINYGGSISNGGMRRHDFVLVNLGHDTEGENISVCCRIFAILSVPTSVPNGIIGRNDKTLYRNEIFLYVALLEVCPKGEKNKSVDVPLDRMKYRTMWSKSAVERRGNQERIECKFIRLDEVIEPIAGYHDVDTKPTEEAEGRSLGSLKQDRFFLFTLGSSKLCRRTYIHLVDEGKMLF